MQILDTNGNRLYLTQEERKAFLSSSLRADPLVRTLCGTLHYTGCRISEALELTASRVDLSEGTIVFRSLKKRGERVFRSVPVPPDFLDTLDLVHGIRKSQRSKQGGGGALWSYSRKSAYRRIKEVMAEASIAPGPHCSPKGLRHGFGVHAVSSHVPLNMLQKWLGHATMETTAIYADAVGEEQQNIAARMWDMRSEGMIPHARPKSSSI